MVKGVIGVLVLLGGMLVLGLAKEIGLPLWATIAIAVVVLVLLIRVGIEQFSNPDDDGDDYDRFG